MTDAYLPGGWESNRFSEVIVGKPQYGLTARSSTEVNDVVYVRISDITGDGSLRSDEVHYLDRGRAELDKYRLHENDFLIARTGASVGRVYLHKDLGRPSVFASYLIRFKLDAKKVLPKFVLYWGSSSDFKKEIASRAKIAAQPNVNAKDYCRFKIPVPPLSVQKRICDILDRAKDLERTREQANQLTGRIIQSVFLKMFGDSARNEKGWDTTRLVKLVRIMGGGTPPTDNSSYWKGSIPWVSPKDMKTLIITNSIDHVSEQAVATGKTKLIPAENVLLVIRSGILKKQLPIAINSVPVAINQDLKALIPLVKIDPYYLLFHLMAVSRDLLKTVKGTTADNISTGILKETRIMVPPYQLQERFSKLAKGIFKVTERQERSTAEINELFRSLMQKAFRGELVS